MKKEVNTDKGVWYKVYGKKELTKKVKDGEVVDYIKIDGNFYDIELKPFRMSEFNDEDERICKMCGRGYPCICSEEDKDGKEWWLAHCMYCNWSLSQDCHMGSKETAKESYEEARSAWNALNIRTVKPRRNRKEPTE